MGWRVSFLLYGEYCQHFLWYTCNQPANTLKIDPICVVTVGEKTLTAVHMLQCVGYSCTEIGLYPKKVTHV